MNYDYSSDEAFLMSLIRYSADKRLEKTHVHVTGNEPYVWSYVSQWVQHLGGICRDPYTLPYWPGILDELDAGHTEETILGLKEGRNYLEKLSYVVIGRQNFNKAFLAICLHYQRVFDYRCVSQEYFLELIKYNRVREYYPGDPRISLHPRLSFLAEVGFQWPSIEAYPSYDTLRTYNGNLADVSELRMLG
jgi:hypothetical protein